MIPVEEEDVCEIATEVWTTMLGVDLEPSEPQADFAWNEKLSSCVTISGTWEGVVVLDFSPAFGRRATCLMFAMEDDEVTEAEITDTVGELANMVGGSIKSLLDEPCKLGIPQIGSDCDNEISGDDIAPVMRMHFSSEGETVQVTLYSREASAETPEED